jgi:hypothetical protein
MGPGIRGLADLGPPTRRRGMTALNLRDEKPSLLDRSQPA